MKPSQTYIMRLKRFWRSFDESIPDFGPISSADKDGDKYASIEGLKFKRPG